LGEQVLGDLHEPVAEPTQRNRQQRALDLLLPAARVRHRQADRSQRRDAERERSAARRLLLLDVVVHC
jgi:hypothetical protein